MIQRRVTSDYEIITTYSDNSEKWHFKMEWCRKAGFSPYNDLYWELAELVYAQRYFDCSPGSDISLKKFQGN